MFNKARFEYLKGRFNKEVEEYHDELIKSKNKKDRALARKFNKIDHQNMDALILAFI
jgi:hypothetical protein